MADITDPEAIGTVQSTYKVKSGDNLVVGGVSVRERNGVVTITYDKEPGSAEPRVLDKDQHVSKPTEGVYSVPKGVKVTFGKTQLSMVSTCHPDSKTYEFLGVDDGDN